MIGKTVRWESGGVEKVGRVLAFVPAKASIDIRALREKGTVKINSHRSNKDRLVVLVARGKPGATPRIYGPTADRVEVA